MVAGRARTVLGDVRAADLGRVNYHEHLFQVSPLLPGDELDDEERSGAEADLLHRAGTQTMVEATPSGLGRNPAAVARISAATGLRIVATTGAHRQAHYGDEHWLVQLSETELTRRFTDDVANGMFAHDDPDGSPPPRVRTGPRFGPACSRPESATGRCRPSNGGCSPRWPRPTRPPERR